MFEAVLAALADHGFTPTAIVTPADLPVRARLRCRARWPPGCSAAARGSSASPRTAGGSCARGWPRWNGRLPDDRRGVRLGRARRSTVSPTAARRSRALRAGPAATTCTRKCRTRAPRGCFGIAPRGGRPRRPAPGAVHTRSGAVHPQVLGRTLPLNGAGVCGAALADLGLPVGTAARLRAAGPHRRAASATWPRSCAVPLGMDIGSQRLTATPGMSRRANTSKRCPRRHRSRSRPNERASVGTRPDDHRLNEANESSSAQAWGQHPPFRRLGIASDITQGRPSPRTHEVLSMKFVRPWFRGFFVAALLASRVSVVSCGGSEGPDGGPDGSGGSDGSTDGAGAPGSGGLDGRERRLPPAAVAMGAEARTAPAPA